jgi:hypothetical protein
MELEVDLFKDARRAGIDLDLIDTNLALSVDERWRQHDAALRFILQLQKAKLVHDSGLQPVDR